MKKKLLVLLLIVPILLIPILSCDGLESLSDLMGEMGTNSLVKGGVVVIDTSQGAKASGSMSALADLKEEDDGYEDAYKDAVKDIKDAATEALASKGSTKANAFVNEMQKPLEEDAPKPKKVTDAVDELKKDPDDGGLGIEIVIETEGDLLAAILLVDLMEKATDTETDWDTATEEEIMEFVSEALQVIDIVKTVSPVNGVKIDDILGELLKLDLDDLFKSRKGVSRDGDPEDMDEALGMIKPILATIINGIGKYENGEIDEKGLKRMTSSFGMMRISYEQVAPLLAKNNQELELTDVVNYVLSVVFTEADKLIKAFTEDDSLGFADLINAYIAWDGGGEGAFNDLDALFAGGEDDPTLIEAALGGALDTLELLLDATPGTDLIKDLLAKMQEKE
jgi:hypothetical protein